MEWLSYLLKVTACMALFYACYHFCLSRLTFFGTNRAYLLGTLLLSFVIPAMQFQMQRPAIDTAPLKNDLVIQTYNFAGSRNGTLPIPQVLAQGAEDSVNIDWQQLLFSSYWIIAAIMLTVFALQGLQLLKHTRKVNMKVGRLKVIFKHNGFTNCSFFNYVFINQQELSEEEMKVILQHEQVHVSRNHSVDKLLISACKALLWFNPVVYLYDKALEQVHEYEADKETSLTVGDTLYANLLLAIAIRKNSPSLVHSFVRNPMKGRLKMLFTSQSKNMKKLMYLAVLPLGLALIWAFAVEVVYASIPVRAPKKTTFKSIPAEKAPMIAIVPTQLKKEKPVSSVAPMSDTVWMVSSRNVNRYSEVIIDGKSYCIDILTKISPSCIKSIKYGREKIDITTDNNEITYATKIDRENAIARDKARAANKHYIRYTQKNQDGSREEQIEIYVPGEGGGSVWLEKGKKLLLVYEGEQYSERKFKALTADQFKKRDMTFSTDKEIKTKYGKGYGSMIEVFAVRDIVGDKPQPFRDLNNADASSKLSYQVKDSIWVSDDKKNSTLFGGVKITQGKLNITADKAKYEVAGQIIYAKNVSFTSEFHHNPVTASFMKFNLKEGTYQILKSIADL